MTATETHADAEIGARDYLDFVFDASGWECLGESQWHLLANGQIGGREMQALTLGSADSPVQAQALTDLAHLVRTVEGSPLILVLTACEVTNETDQPLALSHLLAELSRRKKRDPILAVVLGPLVGPAAMLARISDIICFGPAGNLALADRATTKRISRAGQKSTPPGDLRCAFATDAAALLGVRRLASLLSGGRPLNGDATECSEDMAFERLAGSHSSQHVDERRLLQRIADDRTFVEFASVGSLTAFLATVGGQTVGVLANASTMSGVLDAAALSLASRLVSFCTRNHMPVLALIDSAGVVPDEAALDELANLISAWADSDIPVIGLVVRKATGAATVALIPSLPAALVMYWPEARVGLLRNAPGTPRGRRISFCETRRAIVETLASIRETSI